MVPAEGDREMGIVPDSFSRETAMPFPSYEVPTKCTTYERAVARYGQVDVVHGIWTGEARWMVLFEVPPGIASGWVNVGSGWGMATYRIYCNRDLVAPLQQALDNISDAGLIAELKSFDECFAIRTTHGDTQRISTHAYGLAIDINAAENPVGAPPALSDAFVTCWTAAGFDWGGHFSPAEGRHFSYAWEGGEINLPSC